MSSRFTKGQDWQNSSLPVSPTWYKSKFEHVGQKNIFMKDYKRGFIEFCIENEILTFGEFTLKSGRKSPYFFNAGLFNNGEVISKVGEYYAKAIVDLGMEFDVVFGPAYKGIPLVVATVIGLNNLGLNASFGFNRKEVKDHGEGGIIVGSKLLGNVLVIDDVITAGTAIRESVKIIEKEGGKIAGVLVLFDRKEKGKGSISAIEEVKNDFGIRVESIINVNDLIDFFNQVGESKQRDLLISHQKSFGA